MTAGTILFQLVPLGFALLFGATLENVLASAVIVRLLTAARMGWQSAQVLQVREVLRPQWSVVKGLFNFGGWMLVSTVITMATESVDRLFVGAAFGAQQMARYSVPKNLVIRLGIVSLLLRGARGDRLGDRAKHARPVIGNAGVIEDRARLGQRTQHFELLPEPERVPGMKCSRSSLLGRLEHFDQFDLGDAALRE